MLGVIFITTIEYCMKQANNTSLLKQAGIKFIKIMLVYFRVNLLAQMSVA